MGHVSAALWERVGKGMHRTLSDVPRIGRHSDELCYVACDMDAVVRSVDGSRYE